MAIEMTAQEKRGSVQEIDDIKQDVDLLNYIYAVFDAKWFIVLVAIVTGGLSMLYAVSLPETYQGVIRVDVIDIREPGGVRPDSRQAQESIGMLEYDFLLRAKKENYIQKIIAHLGSKQFTRHFLDSYNIYRYIYPQQWNNATSIWNEGFLLDKGLAQKIFMESLIQIAHAPETDIVAVKVINKDPAIAAELCNLYVYAFNQYMREQALVKVERKFRYLEETLDQTGATEIQQMLFRLMEAQTAVAMLANGREEYILEVLDPAVSPYSRYSPSRKLICMLGGGAGVLLSTSLVMVLTVLGKLKNTLVNYAAITGCKPVAERDCVDVATQNFPDDRKHRPAFSTSLPHTEPLIRSGEVKPTHSIRKDPDIMSLLSRLPQNTASELTDIQLSHLKVAIGNDQYRTHKVDIRGTFPVPFYPSRIYFVLLMGRNIRSLSRQEKYIAMSSMILLTALFFVFSTALGLMLIYVVKSALGIDLFESYSLGFWDLIKGFSI